MTDYAKIRTSVLVLEPVAAATAPANSVYVDSTTFDLSSKSNSNVLVPVTSPDASLFKKQMQSGFAGVIPANRPLSKLANGKVVPTDSDAAGGQNYIGISLDSFGALDALGLVLLVGANAAGALTGLGFTSGDSIFIGETTGGYVSDVSGFTGDDDSIIKVGVADCPAGSASPTATDLILFPEVIARP